MLKFTEDHEWLKIEGGVATIGITEHATEQLGDLVFVELPETGTEFAQGDTAATLESVKAASDVYAPLSGEIIEINSALEDQPELVNTDPYGDGWLFRIQISDTDELDELLDAEAYAEQAEG